MSRSTRIVVVAAVATAVSLVVVTLVATVVVLTWPRGAEPGVAMAGASPTTDEARARLRQANVPFGLLVTDVLDSSPADRCGLRVGDAIVDYDGSPIYDRETYEAALAAAVRDRRSSNALRVARGSESAVLTVPPGKLGFSYEQWAPAKDHIVAVLRGDHPDDAGQLIADAERDHTLSPTQLLAVRILQTPDSASAADRARREELVAKLISAVGPDDYGSLAYDEFDHPESLDVAIELYRLALAHDPSDVDARLNFGGTLCRAGRYDEAEEVVMVEYGRPRPNLARHGYFVAEAVLGDADNGRKRFASAAAHFRKALDVEFNPAGWETPLLYMHAAGRAEGLDAFERAKAYCEERAGPSASRWACEAAAVEGALLEEAGRRDDALRVTSQWRADPRVRAEVERYWARPYTAGDDVLTAWHALLAAAPPSDSASK